MKREQRRVRLARRQTLLAEVSKRAAMRSLADALAEENRSAVLAQRSRALTNAYGGRSSASTGAALAHSARFAGALASLAQTAESARADAAQQAEWQVEALGQAQNRARRQSERLENALAAYRAARERGGDERSLLASTKSLAQLVQTEAEEIPEGLETGQNSGELRRPRTAS